MFMLQTCFRCFIIPVKAALAVGKNHKVLLMMMWAFAPSAVTVSDATTTSGLGCDLGSGSQSKNSRSYLKLILCCFFCSCPHTKFHPNRTKDIELKRFAVFWLWLVHLVSQKIASFISNSFYFVFSPV